MKPLKFKTRFQKTHEKNEDPDEVYRNKLYAHYKLSKKLEPFLSKIKECFPFDIGIDILTKFFILLIQMIIH